MLDTYIYFSTHLNSQVLFFLNLLVNIFNNKYVKNYKFNIRLIGSLCNVLASLTFYNFLLLIFVCLNMKFNNYENYLYIFIIIIIV